MRSEEFRSLASLEQFYIKNTLAVRLMNLQACFSFGEFATEWFLQFFNQVQTASAISS